MKCEELLTVLRECNDCICEEHCPYHEERNNPIRCMTKIVGDAADAIEGLQSQLPKWIPVSERLPDVHKNVLCCGSKGGQFIGWVSNYVSNGKAIAFVHGGSGRLITHWQPLLAPPKEES